MDFVHNCVSLSVSCFHTCFSTFRSTTFLERRHAKINKQGPWAPGPLLTLPPNPLNSRPCDVGPLGKWYAGDHAIHTCSKWLGGMFIRLNHVSGMVQIRKRTFQMNTCTHLYIQDPSPPKWESGPYKLLAITRPGHYRSGHIPRLLLALACHKFGSRFIQFIAGKICSRNTWTNGCLKGLTANIWHDMQKGKKGITMYYIINAYVSFTSHHLHPCCWYKWKSQ